MRRMKVRSSHQITLGKYDGVTVEVFMDPEGDVVVQAEGQQWSTDTLKRLLMDSITAEALLRKHVD